MAQAHLEPLAGRHQLHPRRQDHGGLRDVNLKLDRASSSRSSAIRAAASPRCSTSWRACSRPRPGCVLLDGKEVSAPGPERAVVFQNHSLLPWLTVRENVALAVDKVLAGKKSRAERAAGLVEHNLALVNMVHATEKRAATRSRAA